VLAAALAQPGADSLLAGFADVPGVVFRPGRAGGLLRRAEPGRLEAGQWRFSIDARAGSRLRASHVVRDVVLRTSDVGAAEGGRLLADAVLTAAGEAGPSAYAEVQSLLYGLAVVYGLA
jgi:hypothetical protein